MTRPEALFPSFAQLTRFALPAMLAGTALPVMGLVDVGVLGRLGDPVLGNNGLWLALILQLVLRAVSPGLLWPRVVRTVTRS